MPDRAQGGGWLLQVQFAVLAAATGLFLTFLAPYGTAAVFSSWELPAFWILASLLGCTILASAHGAGEAIGRALGAPTWAWLPTSVVLAAAPITLIVYAIGPALNERVVLARFWALYPSVLVLCLPVQIAIHLLKARRAMASAPPQTPIDGHFADPPSEILFGKLPVAIGRDIICMQTEDHYLRVYTALGNALILLRMSDAEAAVGHLDGMRVHRSWWVARSAVQAVLVVGNTTRLRLSNGIEAPVSRDRRHVLRSKGWKVP